MKNLLVIIGLLVAGFGAQAQEPGTTPELIDVVWLKDGSRLIGTITRWELEHGLELRLASGTIMAVPKKDIHQVFQQVLRGSEDELMPIQQMKTGKPYAFKEQGLYHTVSLFFHTSSSGGAGMHYSIGHRFNHRLGLGVGLGYESSDINAGRNFVPLYAELRGFLKQSKTTPYYGVKAGYGFATDEETFNDEEGRGGLYVSPEIGIRFGANKVNFYLGGEYKLQQASYTGGWADYSYTDKLTYRRLQMRCGIVF